MPSDDPLRAEVLSQGDEVLTGQTVDTNAAWLAERLTDLGFLVTRHTTVGDDIEAIATVVDEAAGRAEFVVSTGGLGPTDDDLTAEAVSRITGRPLELDAEALAGIEAFFRRIGRPMAETNRKQAMLPAGARRLDNDAGTAPGFALEHRGALLAFMPGVPREMRRMFEQAVVPLLGDRFRLRPWRLVTLRCAGIGESDLQARVGRIDRPGIVSGFRTMLPENHVKLRVAPDVPEDELRGLVAALRERIGAAVFAVEGLDDEPGGSLAEVTGRLLAARAGTLALEEGASGGLVVASLARHEDAARRVLDARVQLGPDDPPDDPAYRAERLRTRAGADWGLVTHPAGPVEDAGVMQVAAVGLGVAGPEVQAARSVRLPGDPSRRQRLAAGAALDLLRRALSGLLDEGDPDRPDAPSGGE
ncbi:MAG: hypothetical protein Kow0062_03390 [Acidobacteriota bacterium]